VEPRISTERRRKRHHSHPIVTIASTYFLAPSCNLDMDRFLNRGGQAPNVDGPAIVIPAARFARVVLQICDPVVIRAAIRAGVVRACAKSLQATVLRPRPTQQTCERSVADCAGTKRLEVDMTFGVRPTL
jgi:hypothetical protein